MNTSHIKGIAALTVLLLPSWGCEDPESEFAEEMALIEEEASEELDVIEHEELAFASYQNEPSSDEGGSLGYTGELRADNDGGVDAWGPCGICSPSDARIYNSVPSTMTLGKKTSILFFGQCLPSSLALWIGECAGMTKVYADCGEAKFTCTPSYSSGTKSWVVKDMPGGKQLKAGTTYFKP